MSRISKLMMGGGLFLVLSGALLALTGWLMGADTSLPVGRPGSMRQAAAPIQTQAPEGAEGLGDFGSLVVEAAAADVRLVRGEEYGVSLAWFGRDYRLEYTLENDVLKVCSQPRDLVGIDGVGGTITVTLPREAELEAVSVSLGLGDAELHGLTVSGSLTVDTGLGDVDVTGSFGGVELNTGVGDLSAAGDLRGDLSLNTGVGNIAVSTSLEREAYDLSASSGVGGLTCDGESVKELQGGGGAVRLEADTGVGDIALYFDGREPAVPEKVPEATEEVVDLPRELYKVCPTHEDKSTGLYADSLSYDFSVRKTTMMTIQVENLSGELNLGIRNRSGFGWSYDQRSFGTELDTVTLEPGQYTVSISAAAFQGSYRVMGEAQA